MARRAMMALAVFSLFAGGSVAAVTGIASATAPVDHQVSICHANNDDKQPYVQETIDIGSSGYLQGGHNDHTGPIWNPTLKDQHIQWGDIIPPYRYTLADGSEFVYDGLNWSAAGQAIYNNGCAVPPTAVTPGEPTAHDQTCDASGWIAIPATEGVIYTIGDQVVSGTVPLLPGDYTVTAQPADGYTLQGATSWDLTIAPAEDCTSEPTIVTPAAPTFTASQCDGSTPGDGSYAIPSTTGVQYSVDGLVKKPGHYPLAPGESVTVVATALPGYAFDPGATTRWPFTNADPTCTKTVDLVAPTVAPSQCVDGRQPNGFFTIPAVTGVRWTVDGETTDPGTYPLSPGASVVVAAHATEGYQLPEDATTAWTLTNGRQDCSTTTTPPPPTVAGPANPGATIVATCKQATIRLTNLTTNVGDASSTMQVTVNGSPWGGPITLAGGETRVVVYHRPSNVIAPISVAVVADGTTIATRTMAVCTVVEGVTIPGAKPPAAAPAAVPVADPAATLPHTGADGPGLALAGAAMLVLGGLLVAVSSRRRGQASLG